MKPMFPAAIEIEDALRWSRIVRAALCRLQLLKAARCGRHTPLENAMAIQKLCAAVRLAPAASTVLALENRIHDRLRGLDATKLDWSDISPGAEQRRIEKSAVLKPRVGPKEKGVVFIGFENQWARLAKVVNLQEFARDYHLVISPTWSPPHDVVNCIFPKVFPAPIFCLISNAEDMKIFPRLSSRYQMVPLYASSWVNPELFKPVPFEKKDIEICMIANFGKYKRHFLLFRALRDLPKSVRVVLIGTAAGNRTAEVLKAEARAYGVEDRYQLMLNATNAALVDALCRSKVSLIFSRREGSCVAVVESMFANVPVGMFEDAAIGSRIYINEQTGRFLGYKNLAGQLMDFISNAPKYNPRAWAENRISCFQSTQILNDAIKQFALANGEEWTQDIAVHHWRPEPRLLSPADAARLQPAYQDIQTSFGITIGKN